MTANSPIILPGTVQQSGFAHEYKIAKRAVISARYSIGTGVLTVAFLSAYGAIIATTLFNREARHYRKKFNGRLFWFDRLFDRLYFVDNGHGFTANMSHSEARLYIKMWGGQVVLATPQNGGIIARKIS